MAIGHFDLLVGNRDLPEGTRQLKPQGISRGKSPETDMQMQVLMTKSCIPMIDSGRFHVTFPVDLRCGQADRVLQIV